MLPHPVDLLSQVFRERLLVLSERGGCCLQSLNPLPMFLDALLESLDHLVLSLNHPGRPLLLESLDYLVLSLPLFLNSLLESLNHLVLSLNRFILSLNFFSCFLT